MSWSNRDRDASAQIHFSSNIFVAVAVAVAVVAVAVVVDLLTSRAFERVARLWARRPENQANDFEKVYRRRIFNSLFSNEERCTWLWNFDQCNTRK